MIYSKKYENFDSYEKTVFDWDAMHFEYLQQENKTKCKTKSQFVEEILLKNETYKHVHYKDVWDLYVFIRLEMEKVEYSGGLVVFPDFMSNQFNKAVTRMCCGIFTNRYTALSGRTYLLGFDYGH
jgi:hypothetical protein